MKRRFLTSKDMVEMKRTESIQHSIAKRNGTSIVGVDHKVCGCGAYGCVFAMPKAYSDASLPKQKTKMKKLYGRSNMFSGKVVL
jgi:hypothetical protein